MGTLSDTIAAAVQESLDVYNARRDAAIFAEGAVRAMVAEALPPLETQIDAVYGSTTTSLDDIPETAGTGAGLVVLRK